VIEFRWPSSGEKKRYRVRPMSQDEVAVLIWSFYGSKLSSDQIKSVLGKMLGTGQAEEKIIQKAVDHCESVVDRMDKSWGPLISKLIQ
jgi:hypothetical protein